MIKIEVKSNRFKKTINSSMIMDYMDLLTNLPEIRNLVRDNLSVKEFLYFLETEKVFLYKEFKNNFIQLKKIK